MNEKIISIVCDILRTMWLFVIVIFVVVSFYKTHISVEKLESVLEELYEELDEAFEEVDCEEDAFVCEIKELRERIKALEKTTNTVGDIETIKNAQFGLGTVKERIRNDNGYHYVIEIGDQIGLFESEDLFSVGEFVLVVEIEEGKSLLVDLD